MENFLHNQTAFLDAHDDYYTAIVYIHYVFFPSFRYNLILEKLFFVV
jgi:hypothetical protein